MREQNIEKYLTERMKKIGGKSYKWVSPGNSGVPDRLIIFPDGQIVFVELKAPGNTPTKRQRFVHRELRKLNCNVLVIDSKKQIDALIAKWGGADEV
nr:MAG TPA: Nuclease [Caudoviricetes sp.]